MQNHNQVTTQKSTDSRLQELAARWPEWQVLYPNLPGSTRQCGGESFCWPYRVIMVDCCADDLAGRTAHAYAHLALHMGSIKVGQWFTPEQEQEANWLAGLWLDRTYCDDWQF